MVIQMPLRIHGVCAELSLDGRLCKYVRIIPLIQHTVQKLHRVIPPVDKLDHKAVFVLIQITGIVVQIKSNPDFHRLFANTGCALEIELGVSFDVINYICLSFVRIHADIYFNYISYFGLLIFCCQNVAIK